MKPKSEMIDEWTAVREGQSPEQQMLDTVKATKQAEDDAATQQVVDQYFRNSDVATSGPTEQDYDYRTHVAEGGSLMADPDRGVRLPNRHTVRDRIVVGGYDLTTQEKVFNDIADEQGFAHAGAGMLRDSFSETKAGTPIDDITGLSRIAYAVLDEEGGYDEFEKMVPQVWSDEQKQTAFRAAQMVKVRQTLETMFEAERINPTEMPGEVQEEDIDPESLPEDQDWLNACRTIYAEMEGRDFKGSNDDLSDYGLMQMGLFNWNVAFQAMLTTRTMNSTQDFKDSILHLMNTYDRLKLSWGGFGRAALGIFTDPTTYFGFGAGKISSKIGAVAAKNMLKKFIIGVGAGAAATGAVTVPFASWDEYERQRIRVAGGEQEEVDPTEIAMVGAFGGVAGAALGGVAGGIGSEPAMKFMRGMRDKAKQRWKDITPDILVPYQEETMDLQIVANLQDQVTKGHMSPEEASYAMISDPKDLPKDLRRAVDERVLTLDRAKQLARSGSYQNMPMAFAGGAAGIEQDEQGNITFDPEKAIKGIVIGAAGVAGVQQIGIMTRGRHGRYMRGGKAKPKNTPKIVTKSIGKDVINPAYDQVATPEEALAFANQIQWIDPVIIDEPRGLRWRADKETGYVGNEKMRHPNETYPGGRNTYDFAGCGREAWADANGIELRQACYGGACYAESIAAFRGRGSISSGELFTPQIPASTRRAVQRVWKEEGIEAARERFPEMMLKYYPDMDKLSIKKQTAKGGRAAIVSTNVRDAKGQDIRLGVDTDGSAWLAEPKVMDGLLKANPRTLTVYSSAYHKPPPPHELSQRTIINVTVSGWHPVPETLARIRWAKEARDNGWNVILREVTADNQNFANDESILYNRMHDAIMASDFFVMQQPLHKGKTHSDFAFKLPGCCRGSKRNVHTCDKCEVAEGLGKGFQKFWGIGEEPGDVIMPGSTYRGLQKGEQSPEILQKMKHATAQIDLPEGD